MNEHELRETLKDFGQLVRPVPGLADLALRQAQRRGHIKRAAVVGGTAFAVAGVFGAAAALPVLERGFAPADGGSGPEPTFTEPPPTPTPDPPEPTLPWPTPTQGPPEPTPSWPTVPPVMTPTPDPEPTSTPPEPTPSWPTVPPVMTPTPTQAPPPR